MGSAVGRALRGLRAVSYTHLDVYKRQVLFELGMRMHADKPIALIQAEGTARIFDVDNVLRVLPYNPNLWTSTLEADKPNTTAADLA